MTNSLISRLLLPRFSPFSITPAKPFNRRNSIFSVSINFFSTQDQPKPSSLSARMSFVFDQIDQIEKQRRDQFHQNDDTLQRIRAWRQSKRESQETLDKITAAGNDADFVDSSASDKNGDTLQRIRAWRQSNYSENMAYMDPETSGREAKFSTVAEPVGELDDEDECSEVGKKGKEAELVHPWPEWIELMERLVQQNYFDHKRRDENRMMQGVGFDVSNVGDEVSDDAGIDFRDYKTVQLACINFGKDRFDILRSMSRHDIQILVGYGCPTTDKKVVFSAKLLRKRVHLDEGDVCSSCSLRSTCSLAYLLTNKEDEARTIDVMRVLTIYGFDYVNGCVGNKGLLKQKSVKTVARKLLHEVVKLSAVPIDPNLPPPVIKKAPPKVKQPPPPPKKRVGRDDIEMKKGDWLCTKCDFMNFAKNTVCLQCDAKRPKRQLLPGEWECPECNFLNYRRNMACFHCDCKRPPDTFMENEMRQQQPGPRTGMEKGSRQQVVSNAWNFDFDDDESDGADIAAFENADPVMDGESPEAGINGGNYRGFEDDFNNGGRVHRKEREFSDHGRNQPGTGFDDFDDEDDIDSYEIDTEISKPAGKASSNDFSDIDEFSESEDRRGSINSSRREMVQPYSKPSKSFSKKASGFSDSDLDFDSDGELSVPPNWKGSHIAGSKHKSSSARNSRKGLSFGSDDDPELNSDTDNDDYVPRHTKGNDRSYSRGGFQRAGRFDNKGGSFSDSDLESDGRRFQRNRSRGFKTTGVGGRGNNFSGRKDYDFDEDVGTRSDRKMGNQRNGGFERSSKGFRSDNRFKGDDFTDRRGNSREADKRGKGFRDRRGGNDDYGSRRMNNRGDDNKRGQGFRSQPHRRSDKHDGGGGDWSPSDFRNSRRVIER